MNQAQAPGTPSPSPRVELGARRVVPGGYLGSTDGPHYLPGVHITPQASTIPGHHSQQAQVGPHHSSHQGLWYPKPPTVVRAEGPAPLVRQKEPTLPGRPAYITAPPTPAATTGLPQMADRDHCSQPHDHNNHFPQHLTIGQQHTPDHLQILQAGLLSHKSRVYR